MLLMTNFGYKLYFKNNSTNRRKYGFINQIYIKPVPYLTIALQSKYLVDKNADNIELLILGGTTGVRGYNKFHLTGNKRLTINFENRFISNLNREAK